MEVYRNSSILDQFFYQNTSDLNDSEKVKKMQVSKLLSSLFDADIKVIAISKSLSNLFLCSSCQKEFVILVKPVKYKDIKEYQKRFQIFSRLSDHFFKPESFAFGFDGSWILAEKFLPLTSISLESYLKAKSFRKHEMLEFLVKLIIKFSEILNAFNHFELEIFSVDPKDVVLLFSFDSRNEFEVKFTVSKDFNILSASEYNIVKNNEKKLIKKATFSLCSIIYYCLNFKRTQIFTNFFNFSRKAIMLKLQKIKHICGITNLFSYLNKKSIIKLQSSKKILTWRYLLGFNDLDLPNYSTSSLFTMFHLKSKELHEKAMKILTSNSRIILDFKPQYFYASLIKKFSNILPTRKIYERKIIEITFNVIGKVLQNPRPKLLSAILPLLGKILESNLNLKKPFIIKNLELIVKNFMNFPTFSIVKLMIKTERLHQIYQKNPKENSEIFLNFAYCLNKNDQKAFLETIQTLKKKLIKDEIFLLLKFFKIIPIHIKLQFSYNLLYSIEDFLASVESTLERMSLKESLKQRMIVFDIFYELLASSKISYDQNRLGRCYQNFYCFRSSPLMIKCLSCCKTYCLVCGKGHIDLNHSIEYLSSFKLNDQNAFFCNTEDQSQQKLPHPAHGMFPYYEKCPVDELHQVGNDFHLKIDKINTSIKPTKELFIFYYTEIEFYSLSSEDFSIFFIEANIEVNNFHERCTRDESFICKVPKIGSGDTFGFGITSDNYLFFTFNGMNLLEYISLSSSSVSVFFKFRKHPKRPDLQQPNFSLYTTEAFTFPEKSAILSFSSILKCLKILYSSRKHAEAAENQASKIVLLESLYKPEEFNFL
jgi:hypothetical protein